MTIAMELRMTSGVYPQLINTVDATVDLQRWCSVASKRRDLWKNQFASLADLVVDNGTHAQAAFVRKDSSPRRYVNDTSLVTSECSNS